MMCYIYEKGRRDILQKGSLCPRYVPIQFRTKEVLLRLRALIGVTLLYLLSHQNEIQFGSYLMHKR